MVPPKVMFCTAFCTSAQVPPPAQLAGPPVDPTRSKELDVTFVTVQVLLAAVLPVTPAISTCWPLTRPWVLVVIVIGVTPLLLTPVIVPPMNRDVPPVVVVVID